MKPDLAAGTGTGSAARRQPNWELLIFAIPFTCFALYMSYGFYSSYQEQQDASSSFRPVPARILSAQVETSIYRQSGAVGSTQVYQPRILYEYGVDGRTYSSHRFGYFGPHMAAATRHNWLSRAIQRAPRRRPMSTRTIRPRRCSTNPVHPRGGSISGSRRFLSSSAFSACSEAGEAGCANPGSPLRTLKPALLGTPLALPPSAGIRRRQERCTEHEIPA